MPDTKQLRERRLSVWNDMQALLEATANNGMSSEQHVSYAKMETEVDRLWEDIQARERAAKIQAELDRPQDTPPGAADHNGKTPEPYRNEAQAYSRAFTSWMRDPDGLSLENRAVLQKGRMEARDLGTSPGAAGGYLVPEEFSNRLFEHLKWFGAVRNVAGQITSSTGADMLYPHLDDTGNVGAIINENTAVSEQDVAFGARTFKGFLYTSKLVQVPWNLLQDSAFPLEQKLSEWLAARLGRIQNTHFTLGSGGVQPEGFVTNATTVSTATSDTLVLKDIVSLIYSVDRAYRMNAVFQMNDAVIAHLRKEQATTGEFVWQPSAQAGEPDRLFGYPLWPNNDMAATPTTDAAKVAAFGDFRMGYLIRDIKGVTLVRLNERYADALQTGFFAWMRLDGQPTFDSASSVPPYKVLVVA